MKLALGYFAEQGIAYTTPVLVRERRAWLIWACRGKKGSAWVRIDNQEGRLLESGRPRR